MKELWKKYKEIITYIIFGVLTTVVSWGSYTVFVEMLSMKVFVGNLLSWVCAIVFAYITNKLWVFESKSWKPSVIGKEIVTFVASRGVTGVIEIVCVPLLAKTGFDNLFYGILEKLNISISILFTDGIYSKIFLSVVVVILNYFFSKFIIFKKKTKEEK
ncbi:MAG: GtrA family protein [Eubacterium sp.]|nr:GtrA family protein [Eubacterium sp.]MDE6767328.1 GtrA family protein [Eubacterium sp.]